jgi:hypothetical protein
MKIVTGALIRMKGSGRFATVVRETYTHRFMDSEQDQIMMAHGMGHLAGTYGSAFDVVFTDNGSRMRVAMNKRNFEVVSLLEEVASA